MIEDRTNSLEISLTLRADTDASDLREPIPQRPGGGLPLLTSKSALRLSITISR
jgi:hypothetical protein